MKVLVSGASGFIGQHLLPFLRAHGHQAVPLLRVPDGLNPRWEPNSGIIDPSTLEGFDAIVHLSGEQVAERWTADKKIRIHDSRSKSTALLARTVAQLKTKPKVFLCASAIGYYGSRGSQVLDEGSPPGGGFLARVCVDWEEALTPAVKAGIRTVSMRFGIILSTAGGALPRILKKFSLGAGGRLGSGRQYESWVTIDDALSAIAFLLESEHISGPVNVVAPESLMNSEFVETLTGVMHCKLALPIPTPLVYFAFGPEMADELLLASTRVAPERLQEAGFTFQHPTLKESLQYLLRNRV